MGQKLIQGSNPCRSANGLFQAVSFRPKHSLAFARERATKVRSQVSEWLHSERPVIDFFRGTSSSFRVEGPWHEAGDTLFPMGSLIRSRGVTAHLDPVETMALEETVREAIERVILKWIDDNDAQSFPLVEVAVDRKVADPKAIARIEQWLAAAPTPSVWPGEFGHA